MKTFAFLAVHSLAQEQTCKDWELEEKCLDQCRLIYTDCTQNCADNTCQTQCVNRYSACMADCPCNLNCPNGCDGCDHPLCNVCDAESNMHSQQCKNEAVQKVNQIQDLHRAFYRKVCAKNRAKWPTMTAFPNAILN